ncbi:hypothetical protein B0H66DRAFT_371414 [Apodospora peruviana]|uniref:DUF676 domain-containing protein n=1 Tax=Apodospora peruviana TaxID=516989 RepID=A0AAE0HWW8_9PEZI|nr:hypothetical protein B0H66DRAFT_371414 [Apodospora peruviana]
MAPPGQLRLCYSTSDPRIDIIAVQGLWANPKYTWLKDGVSWLADLLPQDLPEARIRSFGPAAIPTGLDLNFIFPMKNWAVVAAGLLLIALLFPSVRFFALTMVVVVGSLRGSLFLRKYLHNLQTTPSTEIQDQALSLLLQLSQRDVDIPIVLIGHSFGGLVIKQALIMAANDARFQDIYRSIAGTLFIGTPHRGTKLASAFRWGLWRSGAIRTVLEVQSGILDELDRQFFELPRVQDIMKNHSIHCFYELEPTIYGPRFLRFFSMITVDKTSATWPDKPSIPVHGLAAKHSYLVKFSSRSDPNYRCIAQVLQDIARSQRI